MGHVCQNGCRRLGNGTDSSAFIRQMRGNVRINFSRVQNTAVHFDIVNIALEKILTRGYAAVAGAGIALSADN